VEPTLTAILNELAQSQQSFLEILTQANSDQLYQETDEGWSPAQTLAHISEAREFFAGQIQRVASAPGAQVGRTLEDPHRLQAIAEYGQASPDEIRHRLVASHKTVVDALGKLQPKDLQLKCDHPRLGQLSLVEFIQRFVVDHDRAHVEQVAALLNPKSN
jgi:uncharacterized damage-inducible protein DinB